MSRHLPLIGLAVVVTVAVGVAGARDTTPEPSQNRAYLRARLVAEIRAAGAVSGDSMVDPARVRFDSTPSRVVPGLTFLAASHVSRTSPQAWSDAAMAVRGADARVLAGPSDLARVAGTWRPMTSRDATGFCAELVGWATRARHPFARPWAVGIDGDLPAAPLVGRDAIESTVTPPVARRTSTDDWRVTLWSIEERRTRLYECRLHSGAEGLGIGLTVMDSIPGAGLAGPG
jgi:hypothetical protein